MKRRMSTKLPIGRIFIGGDAPIAVQSMTNTDPHDFAKTLAQVRALAAAGCDIVRMTVPDREAAGVFTYLKENGVTLPLVADIHFDYKLALESVSAGADKIRINPGNVGGRERVRAVARACAERNVPIRIGVNSGSVEKDLLAKYGGPTAEALAESALSHAALLEAEDFRGIVLSVKSSDVRTMIEANRILAQKTPYPLHLGVTEAGAGEAAAVKSAVGIGTLLAEGIGDTVRVSLTDDPVKEIAAADRILATLGLCEKPMMNVVACPTCGRTKISLVALYNEFLDRAAREGLLHKPVKVALMGCAVNGPGEAREADVGIAGGIGEGLLFRHGEILRKVPEENLIDELIDEIKKL